MNEVPDWAKPSRALLIWRWITGLFIVVAAVTISGALAGALMGVLSMGVAALFRADDPIFIGQVVGIIVAGVAFLRGAVRVAGDLLQSASKT